MRWKAVLCVGLVAPLTGCNLAYYAAHNLKNEVVSRVDECRLNHRLRSEARAAWHEAGQQYQMGGRCPEFEDGFLDGYVDYLQHGGVPRPPAIPPLKYRRSKYLSPEGQARVKEYFQGFQYGADVAAASGKREYLTVPLLLPPPPTEPPLNVSRTPIPPPPGALPVAPIPPGVPLPAPQPTVPLPEPKPLIEPVPAPPVPAPPVARPTPAPIKVPTAAPIAPKIETVKPTAIRVDPLPEPLSADDVPASLPPVRIAPASIPAVPDRGPGE